MSTPRTRRSRGRLRFEPLESRLTPHGTVHPLGCAEVCGSVYVDANNDGLRDPGEAGIAGVVIELREHVSDDYASNPLVARATTAADGTYTFDCVAPGHYQIVQTTQPAGHPDGKDSQTGYSNGVPDGTIFVMDGGYKADPYRPDILCVDVVGGHDKYCNNNFGEGPKSPPPPTTTPPPPPPTQTTGREGLTPGFWKNNATKKGGTAWADTGYFMYDTLGSVFNLAGTQYAGLANTTLVQALSLQGGGVNALLRHATAALLNAGHPGVDYPLTTTQIVNQVNAALAGGSAAQIEALKDTLDRYNNLGADLDQQNRTGR